MGWFPGVPPRGMEPGVRGAACRRPLIPRTGEGAVPPPHTNPSLPPPGHTMHSRVGERGGGMWEM